MIALWTSRYNSMFVDLIHYCPRLLMISIQYFSYYRRCRDAVSFSSLLRTLHLPLSQSSDNRLFMRLVANIGASRRVRTEGKRCESCQTLRGTKQRSVDCSRGAQPREWMWRSSGQLAPDQPSFDATCLIFSASLCRCVLDSYKARVIMPYNE